jgi:hypothetical protein
MSVDSPTIQQSLCLANCCGALKNCGVSALRSRGYVCGALGDALNVLMGKIQIYGLRLERRMNANDYVAMWTY